MRLAGLLLAAGEGRRYGGCKQLVEVGGKPLVRRSAELLASVPDIETWAVPGANREAIFPLLEGLAHPIEFPEWRRGLGASIAFGIREIAKVGRYDAVLITLADQAAVSREDLIRLVGSFDGERIAAAEYADCLGVPAIFPAARFALLAGLDGDRGARGLIGSQKSRVIAVGMPNAVIDVDTAHDLEHFVARGFPRSAAADGL